MSDKIMISEAWIGCGLIVNIWNGTNLYATNTFSGFDEANTRIESEQWKDMIVNQIQNDCQPFDDEL